MSGELTEFEQKSAVVPKQGPYAILGGAALALIIFILVGMFAKNEAVTDITDQSDGGAAQEESATDKQEEEIEI